MQRETRLFLSASAFFLSFLAKYVTLVFFPFLLAWVFYKSRKLGEVTLPTSLSYFAAPLIIATVVYIVWNFNDLKHFLADQVGSPQNRARDISLQFGLYTWLPFLFAVFGALSLLFKKHWLTTIVLFIAASVPLLTHLVTNSLPAVHQHTYLSILFLLPLGAYFFGKLLEKRQINSDAGRFHARENSDKRHFDFLK